MVFSLHGHTYIYIYIYVGTIKKLLRLQGSFVSLKNVFSYFELHINMEFLQTGIEPQFILFFNCPEEEMERRLLGRNQVWFLDVSL